MVMQAIQIALIEDSDTDAMIIKRVIDENPQSAMYRLYRCETMFQGREYLYSCSDQIDVVLLDLHLPDTMDGHDSLQQVRAVAPDVPVVVLTSCNNQQLTKTLLEMGADDFVSKGLISTNPDLLCRAIDFSMYRHKRVRKEDGLNEVYVR